MTPLFLLCASLPLILATISVEDHDGKCSEMLFALIAFCISFYVFCFVFLFFLLFFANYFFWKFCLPLKVFFVITV